KCLLPVFDAPQPRWGGVSRPPPPPDRRSPPHFGKGDLRSAEGHGRETVPQPGRKPFSCLPPPTRHAPPPTPAHFSTTQMSRNCTGLPWSCSSTTGPGASVSGSPPGVGPFSSRFSWITTPLCRTVTTALPAFLPPSNRAALKSMS